MKNLITVQSIESTRYLTNKYVILNFYISDLVNNQIKVIEIITKVHLVHNLKNCLEKIIEIKKKYCYLVDENSHDLAALKFVKLSSKCEYSEHSHSATNSREDVSISFDIKIH